MNEAIRPVEPNSIVSGTGIQISQQDDESSAEVKRIMSLYEQGKQYRAKFDNDWETRKEFYLGKQWKKEKETGSLPVMNVIRQIIQATIPILTDTRPGFNVLARDPSDYSFASVISTLVEYWWDKVGMDHTLIECIFDSMLYDAAILKVTWDPDAEDGIGDVCCERIDPRDIFVPPECQDFIKNCGWVIQRSKKEVGKLRRMFPDKANLIKADTTSNENDNKTTQSLEIKLVSPVDRYSPKSNTINESADNRKLCEVMECWIDDESIIEESLENEDGTTEKIVRKKYPKGKVVTILPNQSLLLQSVESPYAHGLKPYIRIVDMILPGEFWGEGETKSLMSQQRMINKVLKQTFDVFQLMSNPQWIKEKGNGLDSDQITNTISAVLEVDAGKLGSIRRDFPPALQSGSLDLYNTLIRQVEQISGIAEVTQGRRPQGITAASAIENLQEASQTRIRMKEHNLEVSLQQLGTQVMSLMMQFYREPRVVRITNKTGAWPEYFEFFIEENPVDAATGQVQQGYILNKKQYTFNPEKQQYQPDMQYDTSGPTKGLMDVKVMSGTAMPQAKTTRSNIAFRLYDLKVIDPKELLETLEWPNSEQIIQRMQKEQAAAEQQMPPRE